MKPRRGKKDYSHLEYHCLVRRGAPQNVSGCCGQPGRRRRRRQLLSTASGARPVAVRSLVPAQPSAPCSSNPASPLLAPHPPPPPPQVRATDGKRKLSTVVQVRGGPARRADAGKQRCSTQPFCLVDWVGNAAHRSAGQPPRPITAGSLAGGRRCSEDASHSPASLHCSSLFVSAIPLQGKDLAKFQESYTTIQRVRAEGAWPAQHGWLAGSSAHVRAARGQRQAPSRECCTASPPCLPQGHVSSLKKRDRKQHAKGAAQ